MGGAAGILCLFLTCEDSDALLTELESWYSASKFPEYQPDMELVTTVSDSVNCIDSVGTWMDFNDLLPRVNAHLGVKPLHVCLDDSLEIMKQLEN